MQDDLSESKKKISHGDCSFIKPKKNEWLLYDRYSHVMSNTVLTHVISIFSTCIASYDRDSFMSSKISSRINKYIHVIQCANLSTRINTCTNGNYPIYVKTFKAIYIHILPYKYYVTTFQLSNDNIH